MSESASERFTRTIGMQSSERKTRGWDMQSAERRNRRFVNGQTSSTLPVAHVGDDLSYSEGAQKYRIQNGALVPDDTAPWSLLSADRQGNDSIALLFLQEDFPDGSHPAYGHGIVFTSSPYPDEYPVGMIYLVPNYNNILASDNRVDYSGFDYDWEEQVASFTDLGFTYDDIGEGILIPVAGSPIQFVLGE